MSRSRESEAHVNSVFDRYRLSSAGEHNSCPSSSVAKIGSSPMLSPAPARELGVAQDLDGEFDPGSGRTLAARLTHASRARTRTSVLGRAANGCVTREQPAPKTGTTDGNVG
jgi:hypothetical protein